MEDLKDRKAVALEVEAAASVLTEGKGLRITFEGVNLSVLDSSNKGQEKFLLKDVSGYFFPGRMAALMGPSGSGKTTLLDVLAGRKTSGKRSGSILFEGKAPSAPFLRRYAGYVEQFDTLLGMLTPYEMMMYTAELKRPISESRVAKEKLVNDLLKQLGLEECRDYMIGDRLIKGISGGQKKRVNIGIALVMRPRTLFLDEPTTGLDSYTSNEVMSIVQQFAYAGVTVVATIHSPTSFVFSLFDDLHLLVKGRTVYFGKRDSSVLDFLVSFKGGENPEDLGAASATSNECELLVDIITKASRDGHGPALADLFEGSKQNAELKQTLEGFSKNPEELSPEMLAELAVKRATETPYYWAVWTYWRYRSTRNYTMITFIGPRVLDKVYIILLVGTIYWRKCSDFSTGNLVNLSAVMYMWVVGTAFGAFNYVPAMVLERPIYVRERNDGLLTSGSYLTAKATEDMSLLCVASLVVTVVYWFMTDMHGSFWILWLVYYICTCVGVSMGYFVAAIAPSMQVANSALPIYSVTLMIFAGFFMRLDSQPPWWHWYSYLDYLTYGWAAVMINEFDGTPAYFPDSTTFILDYYGIRRTMWENIGLTCLFLIGFLSFTWITLTFRKFTDR